MHRKEVIQVRKKRLLEERRVKRSQQKHQRLGCRFSLFNYLRKADGAAERYRDSNVVSHPQVDGVDAAAHVDLVV